jgi:hypothetical protein
MPRLGFEPTIQMFERAKSFYALDCAATVIGTELYKLFYLMTEYRWLARSSSKSVLVLPVTMMAGVCRNILRRKRELGECFHANFFTDANRYLGITIL